MNPRAGARGRVRNPFNGIEKKQIYYIAPPQVKSHVNPFNGIEKHVVIKMGVKKKIGIHSMELKVARSLAKVLVSTS